MPTPVHSHTPFAEGLPVPSPSGIRRLRPWLLPRRPESVSRAPSLLALHPGVQGPAVKKLQRMLARLGYPVKPDGQFGPHTATMVRTLRADAGLDRSARVTKRFLNVLKRAQRGGPGDRRWLGIRRLRVGAQGKDVRALQNALTKLGYPAATDGAVRPGDAHERAHVRARGRPARRRRPHAARGAHAQAASPARARRPARSRCARTQTATRRRRRRRHDAPQRRTSRPARSPRRRPRRARSAATASRSRRPARPPPSSAIIQAGNVIAHFPYRFGGGHQNWQDTGYDCSGSVSYALHGAGLLDTPLASYDFYNWGEAGPGQWVTIYAKDDHAYMVVAGLRYDTAASKGGGSRWTTAARAPAGYVARHPAGL